LALYAWLENWFHFPCMGHLAGVVSPPFPPDSDADPERDGRSQTEWFDAVIGYLEFRAGSRWRRGRSKYRNAPRYLEYLDALRLLQISRYEPAQRIEPVLPAKKPPARVSAVPWTCRPWDHFKCCRCATCRSLRMRGIDPASTCPERRDIDAA
jgi:hypothetical protein